MKSKLLYILAMIFCGALFLICFSYFSPAEISGGDDILDYASIARNISGGDEFKASAVYPIQVAMFPPDCETSDFPVLHRSPLYPILISAFFSLFHPELNFLYSMSIFFYLITSILLFLVLSGDWFQFQLKYGEAFFISLLYLINPVMVSSALSGLSETIYSFFLSSELSFSIK